MSPRSTLWRALRATLLASSLRRTLLTAPPGRSSSQSFADTLRRYFFFVDTAATWRDGWVYLLPRREWLSPTAVRPIDRLRVTPADFPLLEKIVRHRQGVPLVRAVARATILRR